MSTHENLDHQGAVLSPAAKAFRETLRERLKAASATVDALAAEHPEHAAEYVKRVRLAELDKSAQTRQREAEDAAARAVAFTAQENEAREQAAALRGALAGFPAPTTAAQRAAQTRMQGALVEAELAMEAAAAGHAAAVAEQSAATAARLRVLEQAAAIRAELPHPARMPLHDTGRTTAGAARPGRPRGGRRSPADWWAILDAHAPGIEPLRERYTYDRETGTVTGPRGTLDEPAWRTNGQPGRHMVTLGKGKQASVTHGMLIGYLAETDPPAEAVPELPPGHPDRWAWPHLRLAGAVDPATGLPLPPTYAATGEPATDPALWAIEQRRAADRARHAEARRKRRARPPRTTPDTTPEPPAAPDTPAATDLA